ncbi:MAG: C40 family peptidase [Fimbriimonadales bacterium]
MRVTGICAALFACLLLVGTADAQRNTGRNPKRAKVGKLGQLNQKTPIFAKPDKGSRILYRGDAQLYVVMKSIDGDWVTLVMADGTNGYLETKYVDSLPYEVNVKKPEPVAVPIATRGGFERRGSRGGSPVLGDDLGSQIVRMGMNYVGTPYVWGGNSLSGGIDCSGFVQQLFRAQSISLPRTAQEQSYVGMPVDNFSGLQAGDRLYFTDSKRARITHTGIYMGNGHFIHSSSGLNGIYTSALNDRWMRILINVRR